MSVDQLDTAAVIKRLTDDFGVAPRYITPDDPEWPTPLNSLGINTPEGLWVIGLPNLDDLVPKTIVVSGSRASTDYGNVVATELGTDLTRSGHVVVNGGAFGIDAAALRGALSQRTEGKDVPTIVVLAAGLDNLYPIAHEQLFKTVVAHGGLIVTENHFGEVPSRASFIARQRLVAALASGLVLVEATPRSTARHLVDWACHLNRKVMAVPGPVTSLCSRLNHQLIADHVAELVFNADQVLDQLRISIPSKLDDHDPGLTA